MRRVLLSGCAAQALLMALAALAGPANAQDAPKPRMNVARSPGITAEAPRPAYNWSGAYIGFNTGAAFGQFDTSKTTTASPNYISNPLNIAAINAAGQQHIRHSGFTGGLQAGYNWQIGRGLIGIEADLNYLNMGRSTTSLAVRYPVNTGFFFNSGRRINQFMVYSYANADWLFTLRSRAGITADNWLFYATGGLALTQVKGQSLFADGNAIEDSTAGQQQADIRKWQAGYIVGGGIETAISERLRLKAEYSFVDFPTLHPQETSNNLATFFVPPASQSFTDTMKLRMHLVRVGLNYAFAHPGSGAAGNSAWAAASPSAFSPSAFLPKQIFGTASDWEFDIGARTWFSTGTIGAPQALLGTPPPPSRIISRLTYEDLQGLSGETFARLDHRSGWFVKGFVGAGAVTSGTLVDEDFAGFQVYSNTRSSLKGNFGSANIDIGYSFLKVPGARVGAFVGYNYYTQHMNGFGCNQVAGDTLCIGTNPNYQVFGEDQRYDALRVGLTAEFWLNSRLKFTAEAAYLPYVSFRAQDDHNQRQLFIQESSSNGDGTMLEAVLSYAVTPNWNVGVGGRLWAWNMHDGMVNFDYPGQPIAFRQIGRYNTERYGAFLQTSYRFGDVTRAANAPAESIPEQKPMDWTGFYLGGHVGGGVANNNWSDPFPGARTGLALNVAGFGDTIHSSGPLLGVQAGVNWQHGSFVAGLKAAWSRTSLRGENTCYSGVGGLNCQNIINSVGTVTGRLGYAWNRAMVYAEGGLARGQIDYMLNGNTNNFTRGYGETSITPWGWVAGGGVEYALTDNWTTSVEYQHIDLGTNHVPFPTVALVRLQDNTIKQTIDVFKLGVNYKIDWRQMAAASGDETNPRR